MSKSSLGGEALLYPSIAVTTGEAAPLRAHKAQFGSEVLVRLRARGEKHNLRISCIFLSVSYFSREEAQRIILTETRGPLNATGPCEGGRSLSRNRAHNLNLGAYPTAQYAGVVSDSPNRSFEQITAGDLAKLSVLARAEFKELFERHPYSLAYADRLRLICLCQGAARHFVHRDHGVHDFDLWGFFDDIPHHPFPARWRATSDFEPSKFGHNPDDGSKFRGRRVDVMGRSISISGSEAPIDAVQRYLREGRTKSARLLAERPVVVVWPDSLSGQVIWKNLTQAR
jgi:hypothetical protein